MSIAFAVNAGPLAQIGLEIASLPAAYQLATGAYGWFKARERSKSLQELLSVSGGQLISTSSFNLTLYKDIRTNHTAMQGVVVQDQKVQRTTLPKGSTAIPGNPGAACLRALTTGLLCLYENEAVVEILQDLIPYGLVQLNQDDTSLEIEGALLASLRQWVSAVTLEEDSDMFRKFMLETVAAQQSRMTGVEINDLIALDHTSLIETPYVIAVLRWILTPLHKREVKQYPTRSLKAWTMASIMATLGFEVQAHPFVVKSIHEYESNLGYTGRFGETPRVFLVVTGGETDLMPVMHTSRASDLLRPQITMMRAIPWIAFRHLRGTHAEVRTEYLADIWKITFKSAKDCFRGISILKQNIRIDIQEPESVGVLEHQKSLISEFSPELARVCATAMRHFIPMSPSSPGWDPVELREQMTTLRGEEELLSRSRSLCRDNCYVLYAIVCGAIYGLCSNACYDNGDTLGEDSEVAFFPDLLFQDGGRRVRKWAHTVGQAMSGHHVPLATWNDLLFELFLGKIRNTATLTASSTTKHANQQSPYTQRLVLGAQSNGLIAVSDILVELSTRKEAFCFFHINRGQILNFPLTEDHYIQASSYIERARVLPLAPEPNNNVLHRFDFACDEPALRIDVEPCWIDDPRTVQFVLRSQGVPIATLNINALIDKMSYDSILCTCTEPSWELSVRTTEKWQLISIYQLMRTRFKGMSFSRADIGYDDTKALIDGSQSITATIYAICVIESKHLCIARDCLTCAYTYAMENWKESHATIIIPY